VISSRLRLYVILFVLIHPSSEMADQWNRDEEKTTDCARICCLAFSIF
jgi:hypothetical protein